MPMTAWKDIAGFACVECGGPATHFWVATPYCCRCHAGVEGGLAFTAEEAAQRHIELIEAVDGKLICMAERNCPGRLVEKARRMICVYRLNVQKLTGNMAARDRMKDTEVYLAEVLRATRYLWNMAYGNIPDEEEAEGESKELDF